jgi:Fe-S-cluster-containing hydrogenase component 2
MTRQIITLDAKPRTGCGLCVNSCHENALELRNGKAVLLKDSLCDGMGNCLPACPSGAIAFEEREAAAFRESTLKGWPIQMKLVSEGAKFFENADLLISADCAAYAYAGFHREFIPGRAVLIGCPKLDGVDYHEKLSRMFAAFNIPSIVLVKMEVPCCGGLEWALSKALDKQRIPCRVVTISIDGTILEDKTL